MPEQYLEEYGELHIKVKVRKADLTKENESKIFNQSTELFADIENLVNSPSTKAKYYILVIETEEPY